MACTAAQAMQEYYRHPSSPRPPGANSGAGSGAGRGAPHASSSASASYATVRPLPTPQGWGGQSVTSPTLGSGGYSAGQQRGYSSGLKERRTSGSGQATDWRGGYAGYRRDGQTVSFSFEAVAVSPTALSSDDDSELKHRFVASAFAAHFAEPILHFNTLPTTSTFAATACTTSATAILLPSLPLRLLPTTSLGVSNLAHPPFSLPSSPFLRLHGHH